MADTQQLLDQMGRLLNEASAAAGYFDATTRLYHLNAAYLTMQARVIDIVPEQFTSRARASIAVGADGTRARYLRPDMSAGVARVIRYEMLSGTGSTQRYYELPLLLSSQATPILGDAYTYTDGAQRSSYAYYVDGPEIVIVPTFTQDVTDGLQAICVDELALSAMTDRPRFPSVLHSALAYGGALSAVEESKDADESIVSIWRRRWESIVGPGEGTSPESRQALRKHFRRSQSLSINGPRLGP